MKADRYYQAEAHSHHLDKDKAAPIVTGRAAVLSLGWKRYHPHEATVEVIDLDGKRRYLTPYQWNVLQAVRTLRERASMSIIAASLGVAPSTVMRALKRLASMGLVAYDTARGRNGGITVVQVAAKELKARAQSAWEYLKDARIRADERARRRFLQLLEQSGYPMAALNVASIGSTGRNVYPPIEEWGEMTPDQAQPEDRY